MVTLSFAGPVVTAVNLTARGKPMPCGNCTYDDTTEVALRSVISIKASEKQLPNLGTDRRFSEKKFRKC